MGSSSRLENVCKTRDVNSVGLEMAVYWGHEFDSWSHLHALAVLSIWNPCCVISDLLKLGEFENTAATELPGKHVREHCDRHIPL